MPRETASEAFTAKVLARVTGHDRPARIPSFRLAQAIAGAALILAVSGGIARWWLTDRAEELRLAALRTEQATIERELDEIRRLTELEPVVYVGSTSDYDYYIDLRDPGSESAATAHAVPASFRPGI
ncbi:MAG TPA: hypothetical protein VMS56_14900 [Thermoanaerobaculia bacterium]|nr:hypothetical protein [Thermoanaerobaculia bacterium]